MNSALSVFEFCEDLAKKLNPSGEKANANGKRRAGSF